MWLENNGCRDIFDSIYSASTIFGKAKVLKSMMKTNKIDKDLCVYIGDETRDIQAAKEVGLESIAVSWGYNTLDILSTYEPTYLCKVPKDIFELRCFQR
jgi:phosphoglycolate phosphatase